MDNELANVILAAAPFALIVILAVHRWAKERKPAPRRRRRRPSKQYRRADRIYAQRK